MYLNLLWSKIINILKFLLNITKLFWEWCLFQYLLPHIPVEILERSRYFLNFIFVHFLKFY